MRFCLRVLLSFCLLAGEGRAEVPGGLLVEDFVIDHCTDCHGGGIEKGDLDLEELLEGDARTQKAGWEHALLRVATGQMPPPEEKRPPAEEMSAFQQHLQAWLDQDALQNSQAEQPQQDRLLDGAG